MRNEYPWLLVLTMLLLNVVIHFPICLTPVRWRGPRYEQVALFQPRCAQTLSKWTQQQTITLTSFYLSQCPHRTWLNFNGNCITCWTFLLGSITTTIIHHWYCHIALYIQIFCFLQQVRDTPTWHSVVLFCLQYLFFPFRILGTILANNLITVGMSSVNPSQKVPVLP